MGRAASGGGRAGGPRPRRPRPPGPGSGSVRGPRPRGHAGRRRGPSRAGCEAARRAPPRGRGRGGRASSASRLAGPAAPARSFDLPGPPPPPPPCVSGKIGTRNGFLCEVSPASSVGGPAGWGQQCLGRSRYLGKHRCRPHVVFGWFFCR